MNSNEFDIVQAKWCEFPQAVKEEYRQRLGKF